MKNIKVLGLFLLGTFFLTTFSFAQCTSSKSTTASYSAAKGGSDIIDLAVATEDLSTLVAAVKAAGLVETLQGDGPFTVFAPTNAAFEALPAGTVESLLMPENRDQLIKVLTYHVVAGNVMSTDLSNGMKAETVEGSEITVTINEEGVMINNAKVTTADVEATNGVVHIINKVILPPNM